MSTLAIVDPIPLSTSWDVTITNAWGQAFDTKGGERISVAQKSKKRR
jgi:hypothetical protein